MKDGTNRTFVGVIWSLLGTWGTEVLTFLIIVLLARLLSPDQFGIVALAALFVFVCRDIIKGTVTLTLVQLKSAEPEHFDSAFWATVALTTSCALLTLLFSNQIGQAFESSQLAALIPWIAPILILSGIETVPEAWLMRQLKFKALAKRGLISVALGGTTAIALAIAGYGIWSLVAQQLVTALANTVLIWWCCDWRPGLRVSYRHARQILYFGKYMSGTSLCYMLSSRGSIFIIGFFLGPLAVGLYTVGERIRRMLANAIPGAMARAYLPSLSTLLEHNRSAFPQAFSEALRFSAILSLPVFAGLACIAEEVVLVVLGEQWAHGIPVVRFLAVAGLFQACFTVSITAVIALGRADLEFKTAVVSTVVRIALFSLAVQWGIVAVAAAEAFAILIIEGVYIWFVVRLSSVSLRQYWQALGSVIAATATMSAAVLVAKFSLQSLLSPYAALPVLVGFGALVYVAALYAISPAKTRTLFSTARDMLRHGRPAEHEAV